MFTREAVVHNHSVIAVFSSHAEAVNAQHGLVIGGVHEDRIAISVDLTSDGIAAEAPGQAYEIRGRNPACAASSKAHLRRTLIPTPLRRGC